MKNDMPNWNKFVRSILASRKDKEANEDILQLQRKKIPDETQKRTNEDYTNGTKQA